MRKPILALGAAAVLLCSLAWFRAAWASPSEIDAQLSAKRRLFEPIGPGLRQIHRDSHGNYYILAWPSLGLVIFDAKGKQLLLIGGSGTADTTKPGQPALGFAEDCDVDPQGNIYVADHAANQVKVFSPQGQPLRSFAVEAPVSVAVLPDGEVAVTAVQRSHLVTVYGANGKIAREFGDPQSISSRAEIDRLANLGRVLSDPQGRLYFGFTYMPEPTIRQYDRFGYARQSFEFTGLDAFPEAQALRKEIERQEARNTSPVLRPILTAFGVDPVEGDVWMGLHNTLVHFDKDGIRRAEYQIYTAKGARLEASIILPQEDTLLIGSDPLGVFEFDRPDKNR